VLALAAMPLTGCQLVLTHVACEPGEEGGRRGVQVPAVRFLTVERPAVIAPAPIVTPTMVVPREGSAQVLTAPPPRGWELPRIPQPGGAP